MPPILGEINFLSFFCVWHQFGPVIRVTDPLITDLGITAAGAAAAG